MHPAAAPPTERNSAFKGYSTDVVADAANSEVIRHSLYRSDDSALGRVLATFAEQLTDADVEFFATQGYLAIDGLLKPDEIESCTAALGDLAHRRTVWDSRVWSQEEPYYVQGGQDERTDDPELRLSKLAYFVQIEPRLATIARHAGLMRAVHQLIGPGACMIQEMALLKPPFRGSEKPWHQDMARDFTFR